MDLNRLKCKSTGKYKINRIILLCFGNHSEKTISSVFVLVIYYSLDIKLAAQSLSNRFFASAEPRKFMIFLMYVL